MCADAVWSALALNAPATSRPLPLVTVAIVVMFERTIATDGTTATLPPAAPVLALVVARCVVDASSSRSSPPCSVPVSWATVTSSMIATATDAPMPTLFAPVTPPVSLEGSAFVSVSVLEAAAILTSPSAASSCPSSDAMAWLFSISIATEPAMPTAPPPAPLIADAPRPESPSSVTTASIVAPCALTDASAGSTASFVIRA